MFVLNELENILQRVSSDHKRHRAREPARITLPQLERVDVNQLRLASKVRMQPLDIDKELLDLHNRQREDDDLAQASRGRDLSTDMLFTSLMRTIILDNLRRLPMRAFPSARLMICDQESYQLLMKFQFLAQNKTPPVSSGRAERPTNCLIYRQPYDVAAVLQLEEIVEQFSRLDRPFVKFVKEAGSSKKTAQFDYSVVKQLIPFLKISDLVIVLHQIGDLRLRMFTVDGRRDHQILQSLTHYARSAMLLELRAIDKAIGQHHLVFDNVTTFLPHNNQLFLDSMRTLEKQAAELDNTNTKFNYHLVPPLSHLTLIAYRLVRLVQKLEWTLESITFRLGDPNGFTKLFSRIFQSILKCDSNQTSWRPKGESDGSPPIVPVRVLVLDRYFDFQGLLRHSDHYGSFVEQELQSSCSDMASTKQLTEIDKLDELLYPEKIEDVLSALLRLNVGSLGASSRAKSLESPGSDSQATQKHLMIIKQLYKTMNDGYLLMRKLESSIESMLNMLSCLKAPLGEHEQIELIERIKRLYMAFRKLVSSKSGAIKVSDSIRFACMLIDLINVCIYLQPSERMRAQLLDLKISIVLGKELMAELIALIEARGNDLLTDERRDEKGVIVALTERLDEFDRVSSKNCPHRSLLSLEDIIEQFYKRQLDPKIYPTQKLARVSKTPTGLIKDQSRNKIIVLTLGSMSYDELHRIKRLESRLAKAEKQAPARKSPRAGKQPAPGSPTKDLLLITCGFIRPDEFVYSL